MNTTNHDGTLTVYDPRDSAGNPLPPLAPYPSTGAGVCTGLGVGAGDPLDVLRERTRHASERGEAWITLTTGEADALLDAAEEDRETLSRWHREYRAMLTAHCRAQEGVGLAEQIEEEVGPHDPDTCHDIDCAACSLTDHVTFGWLAGWAAERGAADPRHVPLPGGAP